MFDLSVRSLRLVSVSILVRLFKGLSCGESFWLYSLLVLFIWVVDNLGVVRHVGRLLDGRPGSIPF